MESISVFDIFKIGVGPSSSHTMGPWRAAQRFTERVRQEGWLHEVRSLRIDLYGSLAKTGKGHGTDIALILGLSGFDFKEIDTTIIPETVREVREGKQIQLGGEATLHFDPAVDLVFLQRETHPGHPNALTFTAQGKSGQTASATYFSVGGGFVVKEGQEEAVSRQQVHLPHQVEKADDLVRAMEATDRDLVGVVLANEAAWRPETETREGLRLIARTMFECIWRGAHAEGILPGGLQVKRRAAEMNRKLLGPEAPRDFEAWVDAYRQLGTDFSQNVRAVSLFALAVNEENAAFGRVVTAPTNGAAGVIPAVLFYAFTLRRPLPEDPWRAAEDFLIVAGEIGSLFKKGATISAAMGGCQAEIGVSSAMAAAGLTHWMGGSSEQCLVAAEIAMEHHLGMTCDPIGGLVQVPCIERNTMGATKAITAAEIALDTDPRQVRVTLDDVIHTMWLTAQDMHAKYKETSEGGLAARIPVHVPEC